MDKVARKPSTDPVQEKLRQNKAQWNKEVSLFINDLINFKKMMNGAPSKFHMEKSTIKEPIPSDPVTILGSLTGDFQELAQKGNNIIKEQIEYSKGRKKTQPKAPMATPGAPMTTGTPPVADLAQQLSAASMEYMLLAEGSNPLTRFYSTLKGPWFGTSEEARNKKYRISMLKSCADLRKQLIKFEQEIMGSSPESIFTAGKMLFKLENQFHYINDTLASLKIQTPGKITDKKTEKPEVAVDDAEEESSEAPAVPQATKNPLPEDPAITSARVAMLDFRKSVHNFTDLNQGLQRSFAAVMIKFVESPDNIKIQLAPQLMQIYQDLLSDANNKHGTNAASLSEILMASRASAQLEVYAQNFFTKWLGQVKHNLSPFDKTSALRLDLLKISENSRKLLDKIMDSLEKDIDYKLLSEYLGQVDKNFVAMQQLMRPLESTIRGKMFDKTFMNMLQNKKLTDYDFGLDPKQKQNLERMLQTKQFRDLTSIYTRK
jgi:hypothetical protein